MNLEGIASVFEQGPPPLVFTSSFAADATKEQFTLPIPGFEGHAAVTRSSYNVFVSIQRFGWSFESPHVENLRWGKADVVRSPVPVLGGESGEVLLSAGYLVDQVRCYSAFEEVGVRRAKFSALHYDLDGHPANMRMAALRRDAIIRSTGRAPCVSVRHCGNHSHNLIDNSVMDAASKSEGTSTIDWMITGSAFFRMGGGTFIRLVQAISLVVNREMVPSIIGLPPPAAALISEELKDYSVHNYKTFVQCSTETWEDSTDSDDEARSPRARADEGAGARRRRRKTLPKQVAFESAWTALLAIFNGFVWVSGATIGPRFS